LRDKTKHDYAERGRRYLAPWLDLPIASITAEMAETRFLEIRDEVAARRAAGDSWGGGKGSGAQSGNLGLKLFCTVWLGPKKRNPAMAALPDPMALLDRKWNPLERRTRRVAAEALPGFWAGVEAQKAKSRLHYDLASLALYTGMREMEISALKWSEVDL